MANFEQALERTLKFEGGYSNNPNDAGGETFCGISRRWWPNWSGWKIIDGAKENGIDLQTFADKDTLFVEVHVKPFYRDNFWTPLHGDEIESQEIANALFDFAVNSGIGDAVKALQKACNKVYTLDGKEASETVKVDGVIGRRTLYAVMDLSESHWRELLAELRSYRLHHILINIGNGKIHPSFAKGLAERAIKA